MPFCAKAAVSFSSISFCAGQHSWLAESRRSPLVTSNTSFAAGFTASFFRSSISIFSLHKLTCRRREINNSSHADFRQPVQPRPSFKVASRCSKVRLMALFSGESYTEGIELGLGLNRFRGLRMALDEQAQLVNARVLLAFQQQGQSFAQLRCRRLGAAGKALQHGV